MVEFSLDHDVPIAVKRELLWLGHIAYTARERRAERTKDWELVLEATRNGWILVTCGRRDFILLHGAWCHWTKAWGVSMQHAGIIQVRQGWKPDRIARDLHALVSSDHPMLNMLWLWQASRGWFAYEISQADDSGRG